jgi:hypothetical protein
MSKQRVSISSLLAISLHASNPNVMLAECEPEEGWCSPVIHLTSDRECREYI